MALLHIHRQQLDNDNTTTTTTSQRRIISHLSIHRPTTHTHKIFFLKKGVTGIRAYTRSFGRAFCFCFFYLTSILQVYILPIGLSSTYDSSFTNLLSIPVLLSKVGFSLPGFGFWLGSRLVLGLVHCSPCDAFGFFIFSILHVHYFSHRGNSSCHFLFFSVLAFGSGLVKFTTRHFHGGYDVLTFSSFLHCLVFFCLLCRPLNEADTYLYLGRSRLQRMYIW